MPRTLVTMSFAAPARSLPYMTKPVVHLELHTGDLPGARAFYAGLCGWRPEQIAVPSGSYLALEMGGALGGGIVECRARRPLWLPYVEVADVGRRPSAPASWAPPSCSSRTRARPGGEASSRRPRRASWRSGSRSGCRRKFRRGAALQPLTTSTQGVVRMLRRLAVVSVFVMPSPFQARPPQVTG